MPFAQPDPGVYFSRTGSKQRVSVKFEIESSAQDDVKPRYVFDETSETWEVKTPTSFSVRMLASTRADLGLEGAEFVSSSPGNASQSRVWKVVRCIAPSTIERTPGSAPTGRPIIETTYSLSVPLWVNRFLFVHSIYKAISDNNTMFDYATEASPSADDIIAFISPFGKRISLATLDDILTTTEPPDKESGIRPTP
jgi:hypothetical protein